MVKLKFLKDVGETKKESICECDEEEAKLLVEDGCAEYIIKPKTKKELKILQNSLKQIDNKETIIENNNLIIVDEKTKENEKFIKILKRKNLFNEITEKEMDKKIVRETETRKAIFLCAQGRLVENCQIASYNLLVNDDAGTGKDYVTEKTLEIIPEEEYIKRTRISPTVFTYWHNPTFEPEWTWNKKIFYNEDISEIVLNSEVFKVMCSSGSNATVVIKQRVYDINIKGKPVMIITTANSIPNPEMTRRFEFINLDESIDQTKEIMIRHANYAKLGISPEYNPDYKESMKLLKRVKVRIPYADKLPNLFPDENLMMRTKFVRFLDLIKASAAFHQYQRKIDEDGYILANNQDYEISCEVMKKLTSNKYMISLTRNQRKIVEFYENNPIFCENLSKINEKMQNFISLPALKTNVGILTKFGILEVILEKDSLNRDIEKYKLSNKFTECKIEFPSFKKLVSKVSKVRIVTKDSKDTKALEMEVKKD